MWDVPLLPVASQHYSLCIPASLVAPCLGDKRKAFFEMLVSMITRNGYNLFIANSWILRLFKDVRPTTNGIYCTKQMLLGKKKKKTKPHNAVQLLC